MNYKELINRLSKYQTCYMGTYPHKYKAFNKNEKNNDLFNWLRREGFFRFHVTNIKREIVYYHQIVAFFCRGGQLALANGFTCSKGEQEIHHLDSNTFNCHHSNLVYLPSEVHAQVTKHQRALSKYRLIIQVLLSSIIICLQI